MAIVFASDFDNTLFFGRRKPPVSPEDYNAVEKFRKEGNLFGLCTGRPLSGIVSPLEGNLFLDFLVTSSGTLITDGNLELLSETVIDWHDAMELYRYGSKTDLPLSIHVGEDMFMLKGKRFPLPVYDLARSPSEHIHCISFHARTFEEGLQVTKEINRFFAGRLSAFQNVKDIDVVPYGCSKGTGLKFIQDYFQAEKTAGMGDSLNDLSLVETADYGFTFPEAPEALRQAAVCTCGSIHEALEILKGKV